MTTRVRVALALWTMLAVVVFNVTFDWQTRAAGHAFAAEQIRRHAGGSPVVTIQDGLRPMVRSAAIRSLGWLGLVMGVGAVATAVAARSTRKLDSPKFQPDESSFLAPAERGPRDAATSEAEPHAWRSGAEPR